MGETLRPPHPRRALHDCPASQAGQSIRQIAAALDRSPSSISRELKRNSGAQVGYKPATPRSRRRPGAGGDRAWNATPSCATSCSAAAVAAGRPNRSPAGSRSRRPRVTISHESIYRFIYAQIRRTNDGAWRHYLPRRKYRRGWHGRRKRLRRRPHQRPCFHRFAAPRASTTAPDLRPLGSRLHARSPHPDRSSWSRTNASPASSWSQRQPGKAAHPVAEQLAAWFAPLDRRLRRTITFDNGTEFAQHHRPHRRTRHPDLLLRPPQPLAERRRRECHRPPAPIPAQQNQPRHHRRQDLRRLVAAYNNTPRKCLDFRTPAEVFSCQTVALRM